MGDNYCNLSLTLKCNGWLSLPGLPHSVSRPFALQEQVCMLVLFIPQTWIWI